MSVKVSPEEAKFYYLRAMETGYASGVPPIKDKPFRGWEMKEHYEDGLMLRDMWLSGQNSFDSVGMTTIFYDDTPLWAMHYGGWYHSNAILTLRAALTKAYHDGTFIGGRGPTVFKTSEAHYTNNVVNNAFTSFQGTEQIVVPSNGNLLGTHWYKGGWLLTH